MIIHRLHVKDTFTSIQGEGYYQGNKAYFIRLEGCDVGCVWCDTKDAWLVSGVQEESVQEISEKAAKADAEFIVITGGEPLMNDLTQLCKCLKEKGLKIHLETSGAYPLTGTWDWITLSPKKFKAPFNKIVTLANELKIIINNKSDFKWAEKYALMSNENCKLFLQPEWGKVLACTKMIEKYVEMHPGWNISNQIHKQLNLL